jgi:hypothetical protein
VANAGNSPSISEFMLYGNNATENNATAGVTLDNIDLTLGTPAAGAVGSNRTLNFTYTPISSSGTFNATLYTNMTGVWKANNTNTSVIQNNTLNNITVTGLIFSNFTWNIYACTATGNCTWGVNRTFRNVGWINLSIDAPANGNNSLSQSEWFNYTPNTTYVIKNATLWSNWSGTWRANETNSTVITGNANNGIFVKGISAVGFVWNVLVCTFTDNCAFDNSGNHTATATTTTTTTTSTTVTTLYVLPSVALVSPPNNSLITSGSFTFTATATASAGVKNFTLYHNLTGVWLPNETFLTATLSKSILTAINSSVVWNARVCDAWDNCTFATSNFTFNLTAPTASPSYANNQTLSLAISNVIGQGFGYAFGSVLVIGIVILIAVLGTLVALKFSFDVILVVMTVLVIAMAGFGISNGIGKYITLPAYLSFLPLLVLTGILFYAGMKIFRR